MLSFTENIPNILRAVKDADPKMTLDVGPGFGKYGLLIREQYLSAKAEKGELSPVDDRVIDCCELTAYFYDRPALAQLYDHVFTQDWFTLPYAADYDLTLLIDVVEHYPKEKIKEYLRRLKKPILVSTPKNVTMYTEHFYGDPHHHESQWEEADFAEFNRRDYSTPLSHILIIQ